MSCKQHPEYVFSWLLPAHQYLTSVSIFRACLQEQAFAGKAPKLWSWRFTSEPHEKLPESSLSALNLKLPPLTRTRRTVTFEDNLVLPGWRPNSYLWIAITHEKQ